MRDPLLIHYARELASTCGHQEASRVLHLLCSELETADRDRASAEALQKFSIMTETDREGSFLLRIKDDPMGLLKLWVIYFSQLLDHPELNGGPAEPAKNYISTEMYSPGLGRFFVEIRRGTGRSAHQMRREAEAERDQLRRELEECRAQNKALSLRLGLP